MELALVDLQQHCGAVSVSSAAAHCLKAAAPRCAIIDLARQQETRPPPLVDLNHLPFFSLTPELAAEFTLALKRFRTCASCAARVQLAEGADAGST